MLTLRSWAWVLLLVGCEPGDLDGSVGGRPFDLTQSRVQKADGDRFEHFNGPIRHHGGLKDRYHRTGDWSYSLGGNGDVNSGVAVYNNAFAGGAFVASCNDKLFVASTSTNAN